mmetsp:Transcript_20548/g.44549  ORF Transcript_20548/g.44549 Transcript_20548/m.44549 type:complete len:184 (+) Transcript_20548:1974-2525(+)
MGTQGPMKAPTPHAGKYAKVDARPNCPLRSAVGTAFVLPQISNDVELRLCSIKINFIFAVLFSKLGGPHLHLILALLATHVYNSYQFKLSSAMVSPGYSMPSKLELELELELLVLLRLVDDDFDETLVDVELDSVEDDILVDFALDSVEDETLVDSELDCVDSEILVDLLRCVGSEILVDFVR